MRLLQLQGDGSFGLTKDLNNRIPPYAILSHTWNEDEDQEVTFKDIAEGTGRNKHGYRKIRFCGERAVEDGLKYIWVDTCCIDKSSSAELQEAINSMFRWYRNATKCYVYLSDVSKGGPTQFKELPRATWKREFCRSRWFTRGWTLQELIAPSSVEFFASDGQRLGDKESLEPLLHEITRVAINALRGDPLPSFNIDERMSWSSHRKTKRPEDKAYSLLGIFDIHMPLIYGEGEEGAFERLRREIDLHLGKPVLDRLPIAAGASFNSHAEEHNPTCLPDTRVGLLREVSEWVGEPKAKTVFWLNGKAGTGKSTISRTLARSFERRQLGASFFFKRGESDRGGISKFFTTIAAQLVQRQPAVAPHVKNAIDADPAIFGKALREQFEKLVLEPLSKTPRHAWKEETLVFIVDALDECERDDDIRLIIHLLSRANTLQSPRLRIFMTSRPELPIRLGFGDVQGTYQDLVLHQIPGPVIEHDIAAFLEHELDKIRNKYNNSVPETRQLPMNWPSQSSIQTLVKMAIPLFIFAATVCRFIDDRRCDSPEVQLRKVLDYQTRSQESKLDATYLPVLNQLLVGLTMREKDKVLQDFRHIVGTIVILANPLPVPALARILLVAQDEVNIRLDLLHSVLDIPSSSSSPVRLLHLSFRDFLLDPEKRDESPFWVDEKVTHKRLAANCLRVMNETLRTDICGVLWPGTPRSSIDPQVISDSLRPEVQYACQHWVYHMEQAGEHVYDDSQVHDFLKQHFLHWLEALSLIERASESLQSIKILRSLSNTQNYTQVSDFLDDATRFILANILITQHAPLQIYCSALGFAPKKSIVHNTFQNELPAWIPLYPKTEMYWGKCLQTLEGHSDTVHSVAFSPDSRLVVSGSVDKTVRLWSADTGELQQTLEGHSDWVHSVAFSPDSRLVVSGSDDKTVRLWSADTGELQQTLEGHSDWVRSVAFSPDSRLVASGSVDDTVRLWSADTGELQQTLEGHSGGVWSVAFSPDSRLVASGSDDKTVRLWSADTGELQQTLEGHSGRVWSVAFSPDSRLVASGSDDKTVRLWSADTGELQQTLEGHSDWVWSVAFSPDSRLVASGSDDKTVRLWSADTGELQQTLEGHSDWVWSVAFSPDSRLVASGSDDKTVRLWSADTGICLRDIDLHRESHSLSFDRNGLSLLTDTGAVSLDGLQGLTTITSSGEAWPDPDQTYRSTYGFSMDKTWITLDGSNLLWLPVNYRPLCSAVSSSAITIGSAAGRVIIIRFSTEAYYNY